MLIDPSVPVRDIALAVAGATAIFEAYRIDYACAGARTLRDACAAHGVPVERVLGDLAASPSPQTLGPDADWLLRPLSDLTAFIVRAHHAHARSELARLRPALEQVVREHGSNRPALFEMRRLVTELEASLLPHMRIEERLLFPYIERLDAAERAGQRLVGPGSITSPIHAAMRDHLREDSILSSLTDAMSEHALPDWDCVTYRLLVARLQALSADLHQHFHLENNVLFPRAIEVEEERAETERPLVRSA